METDMATRKKVFRILSHVAMKRAKDGICKSVIPIFGQGDDKKLEHIGSAILLENDDSSSRH
jgi:hypothetical protein